MERSIAHEYCHLLYLLSEQDAVDVQSIVWHPGRSDAAIRTAAISCLFMELQVADISVDMVTSDLQQLVSSITGLFEEEDRKSRLLAIRCLAALFRLAPPGGIDVQQLHATATELLRRLDDTVAEVRHCAAETFPTLLHALPADYCGRQWRGHLEYFAKTLLVFLDDTDARLQTLVYEALLSTGRLNADVVCEQATEQRDKQRSPQLCDQLVKQLTGDAATMP